MVCPSVRRLGGRWVCASCLPRPTSVPHHRMTLLNLSGIYTFTFAYGLSFGPIGWVLPSEVFPLSMRSKGVALSTMSNWTNNCKFCFSSETCLLNKSYCLVLIGLLTPVLVNFSASYVHIFSNSYFTGAEHSLVQTYVSNICICLCARTYLGNLFRPRNRQRAPRRNR
jgi:hypothetical protein